MTAGCGHRPLGVLHARHTTLHGAQLWVALPEAARHAAPGFEHYAPEVTVVDGARVLVFLGTLLGQTSPVSMHSELVGAEVTLRAGASLEIEVDAAHEHGLLCDTGRLTLRSRPTAGDGAVDRGPGGDRLRPDRVRAAARRGRGRAGGAVPAARRPAARRADRHVVELHRPQPRGGRRLPRGLAARARTEPTEPAEPAETRSSGPSRPSGTRTLPAPELPHLRLRSRG